MLLMPLTCALGEAHDGHPDLPDTRKVNGCARSGGAMGQAGVCKGSLAAVARMSCQAVTHLDWRLAAPERTKLQRATRR